MCECVCVVPCVQLQRTLNSLRILDTKASFVAFRHTHTRTCTRTSTRTRTGVPSYLAKVSYEYQTMILRKIFWNCCCCWCRCYSMGVVVSAAPLSLLSHPVANQMGMSAECYGCCGCCLWGRVGGGLGIAAMWHVTAKRCWLRPCTFVVIVWHMTPSVCVCECVPARAPCIPVLWQWHPLEQGQHNEWAGGMKSAMAAVTTISDGAW